VVLLLLYDFWNYFSTSPHISHFKKALLLRTHKSYFTCLMQFKISLRMCLIFYTRHKFKK
jgi:hypothetical protein